MKRYIWTKSFCNSEFTWNQMNCDKFKIEKEWNCQKLLLWDSKFSQNWFHVNYELTRDKVHSNCAQCAISKIFCENDGFTKELISRNISSTQLCTVLRQFYLNIFVKISVKSTHLVLSKWWTTYAVFTKFWIVFQRFHEFFFQIQNVLMTIAKLKVFSHEIHEIFGDELEALAAIKQLKYFYNLPLGQLFCALAQLYKPNPNSAWWKAATDMLVDSHWSAVKVCDFLKDYVSLFSTMCKFL